VHRGPQKSQTATFEPHSADSRFPEHDVGCIPERARIDDGADAVQPDRTLGASESLRITADGGGYV
jgi:hypothetical protein